MSRTARESVSPNREGPWRRPILAGLLLVLGGLCAAQEPPATVDLAPEGTFEVVAPSDEATEPARPFARVLFAQGGVKITRDEGYAEHVKVNAPIFIGDQVETSETQRAELQLPDGTLVRLDHRSAIQLHDLALPAAPAAERSILALRWGRLHASIPDPRDGDGFRIDSPAASIYPLRRSVVRVDIEPDETTRITVERGRVEVAGRGGSVILRAGERTRVRAGQAPIRPYDVILRIRDAFGLWVGDRDRAYALKEAPGEEYDALPEEVRPYYGELSEHGEWVEDDEYGWVWNPTVEDDWRPYSDGRWIDSAYGPVWYGSEPWAWSVYRYGRWGFRAGIGWCWIPGRVFAPAHVWWYYGPRYVGWCPIGFYDYPVHVSIGWGWGHSFFDYHPWHFVGYGGFWRYHHYRHYARTHASAVRPDFRRGVVARRAVHTRPRAVHRRGAIHGERGLDRRTYDRARSVARRSSVAVRTVPEAESLRRERRSFRETERRIRGAASATRRVPARRDAGEGGPAVRAGTPGRDRQGVAPRSRGVGERPRPVIRVRPGGSSRSSPEGSTRPVRRGGSEASKEVGEAPRAGTRRAPDPVAPRRGVTRSSTGRETAGRARSGDDRVRELMGRVGKTRSGASDPDARPRRATPRRPAASGSRRGASDRAPSREVTPPSRPGSTRERGRAPTRRPPSVRPSRGGRDGGSARRATPPTRGRSDGAARSRSRSGSGKSSGATRSRSSGSRKSPSASRSRSSGTRKSPSASRSRSSGTRKSPSASRSRSSGSRKSPSASRSRSSGTRKSPSASRSRSSGSRKSPSASRSRSSGSRKSGARSRSRSSGSRSSSGATRSSGSRGSSGGRGKARRR